MRGGLAIALRAAPASSGEPGPACELPDFDVEGVEAPLIPEGKYDAIGGRASKFTACGTLKLCVEWTVLVPDANAELGIRRVTLPRFYNVRPAPGSRFRVGRHSAYAREWVLASGRRIRRKDRLSPRCFAGVLCAVEVLTVKRDSDQQPLPEDARYSRIARLICQKAGGPSC